MASNSFLGDAHVVGKIHVEGMCGLDFLLGNVTNSLKIQLSQGGGGEGALKGRDLGEGSSCRSSGWIINVALPCHLAAYVDQ